MNPTSPDPVLESCSERVRANAGPAVFAALCLCFFGYFYFAIPDVQDLFDVGNAIFNYTLRAGGNAMAVIATLSLTGRRVVLLVDALVSIAIGAGLGISAVLMLAGGGATLTFVLYILFAGTFLAGGIRNGREYLNLGHAVKTLSATPFPLVKSEPATASGQDLRASREREASAVPSPSHRDSSPRDKSPSQQAPEAETPLGGFLASFAKKPPESGG